MGFTPGANTGSNYQGIGIVMRASADSIEVYVNIDALAYAWKLSGERERLVG
jgi:hypothetical protein